jgi:hypothetical protein
MRSNSTLGRVLDATLLDLCAYAWLVLRDPALSSARGIARETALRDVLETDWIKLVTFKRTPWPGENLPPDDVSHWHQVGITVYCNPTNCPVGAGD